MDVELTPFEIYSIIKVIRGEVEDGKAFDEAVKSVEDTLLGQMLSAVCKNGEYVNLLEKTSSNDGRNCIVTCICGHPIKLISDDNEGNSYVCSACGNIYQEGTLHYLDNSVSGNNRDKRAVLEFLCDSYTVECPTCGGSMQIRVNGDNGHPFLGCSNYPKCRTTINIDRKG